MAESTTKTAVVTAVLTGVFTVLAGLATYWLTSKEPELSYTVAGGPSLPVTSGTKRIFVVEVRNSGKKEIPQVFLQISVPDGELSEVASEVSAGVKLLEDKSLRRTEVRADLLNPNDTLKVSFLASLPSANSTPAVAVRAPGLTAIDKSAKTESLFSKDKPQVFLVLLTTAVAAVFSSLLLLTRSTLGEAFGLRLGSGSEPLEQSEICAYVCETFGLHDEGRELRMAGSSVSYRGTADYLLLRARRHPPEVRRNYDLALQALLIRQSLPDSTVTVLRHALSDIRGGSFSDAEYQALKKQAVDEEDHPIEWRNAIQSLQRPAAKEG